MSTTSNRNWSHSTISPTAGSPPSWDITKPPRVALWSSGRAEGRAGEQVRDLVEREHPVEQPGAVLPLDDGRVRRLAGSGTSPTSSSRTSWRVTIPAVDPNSSTTRAARWPEPRKWSSRRRARMAFRDHQGRGSRRPARSSFCRGERSGLVARSQRSFRRSMPTTWSALPGRAGRWSGATRRSCAGSLPGGPPGRARPAPSAASSGVGRAGRRGGRRAPRGPAPPSRRRPPACPARSGCGCRLP